MVCLVLFLVLFILLNCIWAVCTESQISWEQNHQIIFLLLTASYPNRYKWYYLHFYFGLLRLINEQSLFSSLRVIQWNFFFFLIRLNSIVKKKTQICFAMWPLVNFIFNFICSCSWASYEPWEISCYMTQSRTDLIQY